MEKAELIKFWLDSAVEDLTVCESLFEEKHHDWRLFIGHLVLEKASKRCGFASIIRSFILGFIMYRAILDVDTVIESHPYHPQDFTESNPFAREILRTGIRIA